VRLCVAQPASPLGEAMVNYAESRYPARGRNEMTNYRVEWPFGTPFSQGEKNSLLYTKSDFFGCNIFNKDTNPVNSHRPFLYRKE